MNLAIVNGPNLNMLGMREQEIYGEMTYRTLISKIGVYARKKFACVDFFQSNSEGDLIDYIHHLIESTFY